MELALQPLRVVLPLSLPIGFRGNLLAIALKNRRSCYVLGSDHLTRLGLRFLGLSLSLVLLLLGLRPLLLPVTVVL